MNGTLSVLLCNLFRFHKEAVPVLRLEFSCSCTVGGSRVFIQKWLQSEQGEITVDPNRSI